MTVKTTGAEFKRFYGDEKFWPKDSDVWHEDEVITIDGGEPADPDFDLNTVADNAQMTISAGIVLGIEDQPSFETYFKRWKRQQDTVVLVIEATAMTVEAIKTAVKAAGGKVL